MVGAVGILLALQTYTNVLRILDAVLADDVSILANTLEVARVNLYARLVGAHFHQDAGLGAPKGSANLCVVTIGVQTVVVVVTGSVSNLVVGRVDRVANGVGLAEVHSGTLHVPNLACGDVQLVRSSELVCIHIQYLIVGSLSEIATQVVVVVIGLVDDSLLVGSSLPSHIQRIVCCELVGSSSCYCARETILSVCCNNGQLQNRVTNLFGIIYLVHPTRGTTTMQAVRSIVLLQLIFSIAQLELTFLDAVGITTYARTVVRRRVEGVSILLDVVETQYYVSRFAVFIGHNQ